MNDSTPAYLALPAGELRKRADEAVKRLGACRMCPRNCGAARLAGKTGYCRTGRQARISSYGPHRGEEPPISGHAGSGAIFFASCNLLCTFCQNRPVSHGNEGADTPPEVLAAMMLRLQEQGCHNINLVTPSHVVPQILQAVAIAAVKGLSLPLLYNTGAYDGIETLRLLDGVIDIYMPDFKFWDNQVAERFCSVPDYRERASEAIIEMQRQVGVLSTDAGGIARRGLLVRHLVMPANIAGTADIMKFIADKVSPDTYVNIMNQYRPFGPALADPAANRPIEPGEYAQALAAARAAGLKRPV